VTGRPRGYGLDRFFVRWHMTLILTGVVLAGVMANRGLLAVGVRSLAGRWLLAVLAAYVAFFGLVRLWMWYVTAWSRDEPAAAGRAPARRRPSAASWSFGEGVSPPGDADDIPSFLALLVLGLVLAVLVGLAAFVVAEVPALLADAAFEALLASGLLRASRRLEATGWTGSLFRATAVPFALVLVVTGLVAWAVGTSCPGARRFLDVLGPCGAS
jgi:hypothetical protein